MNLNIYKPQLRTALNDLLDDYPVPENGIIAGGAVANTLINIIYTESLPINDLDLFTWGQVGEDEGTKQGYAYVFNYRLKILPQDITNKLVQRIVVDLPDRTMPEFAWHLIKTFHLNCVQVAYDWHNDVLYWTPDFMHFLRHRYILFNPINNQDATINILKGYKKHLEKVGNLSPDYIEMAGVSFYVDTRDPDSLPNETYQQVLHCLIADKHFQGLLQNTGSHGFYIGGEGQPWDIAYANESYQYETPPFGAVDLFQRDSLLYLLINYVDCNYMTSSNGIDIDRIISKGYNLRDICSLDMLSRLRNIDELFTLLELVGHNRKLYFNEFNKYTLNLASVTDLKSIVKNFNQIANQPVAPKIFNRQLVTLTDLSDSRLNHNDFKSVKQNRIYLVPTYRKDREIILSEDGRRFGGRVGWKLNDRGRRFYEDALLVYLKWYRLANPGIDFGMPELRFGIGDDIPF